MNTRYNKFLHELKELKAKIEASGGEPTKAQRDRAEYVMEQLEAMENGADIIGSDMDVRMLSGGGGSQTPTRSNTPFESFGSQLQAIAKAESPGGEVDHRLHEVRAATGLSEGIGGDGGFLVQTTYSNDIFTTAWNEGQLQKLCKQVRIGGNSNQIVIPAVDETSRVDGSRSGGTRAYWIAEAGEKQASQPKFRRMELNLNKLVVLTYCTDELLQDATALEQFVTESTAREIAFQMDKNILRGTGAGRPLGLIGNAGTIDVGSEVGQAASSIIYENVLAMWARLIPSSQKSAVWLINQSCIPQLYSMGLAIGTGGSPVFVPSQIAEEGPAGFLFGRPVMSVETCSALGTTGDIILADFKNGYIIADKGPAQNAWSLHIRFLFDENVYRSVYRVDGQSMLANPVTPYGSGDTLSHFLTLETRS